MITCIALFGGVVMMTTGLEAAAAACSSKVKEEKNEVAALMLGSEGAKAADYANYFSSYAYLYHQKQMLSDGARMRAYRDAVLKNREVFENRVVLDVGAGSGILSIWAARAGARKVYAVEFTSMAEHARELVEANGFGHIVEVKHCAVEELDDISVDVIISEWMGYFLLRESMLDSVIYARDRFLRRGGAIFPNRATLYWAPVASEDRDARLQDKVDAMADFEAFLGEMKEEHGVDVSALEVAYEAEQTHYYLKQAQWAELRDDQVLAEAAVLATFDLYVVTLTESRAIVDAPFDFPTVPLETVDAFAGWFDVDFDFDGRRPLKNPQKLSTAPDQGYTHWGQQLFLLVPPSPPLPSSTAGTLSMTRQRDAVRLYNIDIRLRDVHTVDEPHTLRWELS